MFVFPTCECCWSRKDLEERVKYFKEYLLNKIEVVLVETRMSNRVNYRLSKNVPIDTVKIRDREGNEYSITADCVDECTCCYGNNCRKLENEDYCYKCDGYCTCNGRIPHECGEVDTCECEIYYGEKWHVYIGDFKPIVFKNGIEISVDSSPLNGITDLDEIKKLISEMNTTEAILNIILYMGGDTIGNDK